MKKLILTGILSSASVCVLANPFTPGWIEGNPLAIQKSDYEGLNVLFIEMESPVITSASCSNFTGVVIEDSNESSEAAMAFALTALTTGKKFSCYVNEDSCSQVTGNLATFPVCSHYPRLLK